MIKTESKEINGETYRITQFGSKKGRGILVLLVRCLGPAFGTAIGGAGTTQGARIGQAVVSLSQNLTEEDFGKLCDALAEHTTVDRVGKSSDGSDKIVPQKLSTFLDSHFAGAYEHMLEWLQFGIEVNFSSFFTAVKEAITGQGQKPQEQPPEKP